MDQATIARLLKPYVEPPEDLVRKTSIYIDLLLKWNSKLNLTAIRDPELMVTRHFGESFFAARRLIAPQWHGTIIDVGSGAGFPGMPLAIYAQEATVTLIESQGKKAAFLNEVIFALKMGNVSVFSGRAEHFSGSAALVSMRAVERFEKAITAAAGLVQARGRLCLLIGAAQVRPARAIEGRFEWQLPITIPGSQARVILVGTKKVTVGDERRY